MWHKKETVQPLTGLHRTLHRNYFLMGRAHSGELLFQVYSGCDGAHLDFYEELEAFFAAGDGVWAVWETEGVYVSALRLEPYRDGFLLAGLETHPRYRGQGYAQRLLAAVLPEGAVYSHVAKDNPVSLHIHEKLGFQIISDCAVYLDGSADRKAYTLGKSPC